MTMTRRLAPFCVAVLAQLFVFQGCGGSNSPATTGGTGGAASGTGGSSSGTGGTTTAGGTGGTSGGGTGTGGATTAATGGTTGAAGQPGDGGGSGSAGSSGFGQPACAGVTAAGVAVKKGGACTAADPQMCFNTCGPEKTGVKAETCSAAGTYTEGSCAFDPAADFSCYKIPAAEPAACPTTAIQAGAACSVPDCTVCGSTAGYMDSSGSPKTGYCVCQSGASNPTWSCASTTAWPCPNGSGC
jgi:hypothetical protein